MKLLLLPLAMAKSVKYIIILKENMLSIREHIEYILLMKKFIQSSFIII